MAISSQVVEKSLEFRESGVKYNKMKISGYHEGDRSEYLAQFALSTISYCVPVLRQTDYFFCDFLCVLFKNGKKQNTVESTGRSFGIQIKSNNKQIEIERDRLDEFHGFHMPFFVGVVDKQSGSFSVYSTTMRLIAALSCPEKKIALELGGKSPEINISDEVVHIISGLPIAEVNIAALDDSSNEERNIERNKLFEILDFWTILEMGNLAWKFNKIPWIQMPLTFNTNKLPKIDELGIYVAEKKDYLYHAKTSIAVMVIGLKMCLEKLQEKNQAAKCDIILEEIEKLI